MRIRRCFSRSFPLLRFLLSFVFLPPNTRILREGQTCVHDQRNIIIFQRFSHENFLDCRFFLHGIFFPILLFFVIMRMNSRLSWKFNEVHRMIKNFIETFPFFLRRTSFSSSSCNYTNEYENFNLSSFTIRYAKYLSITTERITSKEKALHVDNKRKIFSRSFLYSGVSKRIKIKIFR